jgi:hypothetical protein
MGNLGETFVTKDMPKSSGFDPIPVGWYDAQITGAEIKATKNGNGQYIAVQYTILGPEYQGRIIFANLNIRNKNPKAQEIGVAGLGALLSAIGLPKADDTSQLIGGTLQIKVKVQEAKDGYDARNDVSGWKAVSGSVLPSAPSVSEPSAMPPWAKK